MNKLTKKNSRRQLGLSEWDRIGTLPRAGKSGDTPPRPSKSLVASLDIQDKPKKSPLYLRVDEDVLEWYRGHGKGYQTMINALLRSYMEEAQKRQ